MNLLVKFEKEKDYKQRQISIIRNEDNKVAKKQLEKDILEALENSGDNILEDEDAVQVLENSRIKSKVFEREAEQFEHVNMQYQKILKLYKNISARISILFFAVNDLQHVEKMYQFSLEWYTNQFIKAIEKAPVNANEEIRNSNIQTYFQTQLFKSICNSLLEKDKLLFSYLMCIKVMRQEGTISAKEVRFLATGATKVKPTNPNPTGEDGWLTNKAWCTIEEVSSFLPNFVGFDEEFSKYKDEWLKLSYHKAPFEVQDWPGEVSSTFETFQKLIVINIIAPSKIIPGLRYLIANEYGEEFVKFPSFNIRASYAVSDYKTPFIFIISPGVNPLSEILKMGDIKGIVPATMSLGMGQGPEAKRTIRQCFEDGGWVVLENCHLSPKSFLPVLERIVEKIMDGDY